MFPANETSSSSRSRPLNDSTQAFCRDEPGSMNSEPAPLNRRQDSADTVVAAGADAIAANPGTITGSIGVITGKLMIRDLKGRLSVGSNTVHANANANADAWSADAPFTPEQHTPGRSGRGCRRPHRQLPWLVVAGHGATSVPWLGESSAVSRRTGRRSAAPRQTELPSTAEPALHVRRRPWPWCSGPKTPDIPLRGQRFSER